MFMINIRPNKICHKAILKNFGMLESLPKRYKTQEMCNKAVDNNDHPLEFVHGQYMT